MVAPKTYTLRNPAGELVTVTNLSAWCRREGFHRAQFVHMLSGNLPHAYGWTAPGARPPQQRPETALPQTPADLAAAINAALVAFSLDDQYACSMARAAQLLHAGRGWQAGQQGPKLN